MQTLPLPRLAALLQANAKGHHATEAATALLIGHRTWLRRTDFLTFCVWVGDDTEILGPPLWDDADDYLGGDDYTPDDITPQDMTQAGVRWDDIPHFVATAGSSGSEGRILCLVAELAGTDTGLPLDELLSGLDGRNSALVLDAIAQALNTQLWAGGEQGR